MGALPAVRLAVVIGGCSSAAVTAQVELPDGFPEALAPLLEVVGPDGWVDDDEAALLPYQRAWVYDRSQLKAFPKSRRIGVTWATAYEAVEVAASSPDSGGMDVWYMANALDDAREFIDDCAWWVERLKPLVDELSAATGVRDEIIQDDDDILAFTIRFASGFKIHALTSKPRRLRGKDGYAILDEAAFHDDFEEWLKAAGAFLIWGGRVAVISTYNGVENSFYEFVEAIRDGSRPGSLHETDIYAAVAQGLYRRISRSRLRRPWSAEEEREWLEKIKGIYGDDFEEECACIPSRSGGAYIPQHLVLARMCLDDLECPVVEFKPKIDIPREEWGVADSWDDVPLERRRKSTRRWLDRNLLPVLRRLAKVELYGGADYGRSINLTVLTLLELRTDMTRRARLILELDGVPFDQQDQILDYVWERLTRLRKVCLDATGIGRASAEHARDKLGSRAEMVTLKEGWYAEHWPPLKRRFEDGAIELPNHRPLFDDLRGLRRKAGKVELPTSKRGKGAKARHGDGAVSLVLAEAAVGSKAEARQTSPAVRYGRSRKRRRR